MNRRVSKILERMLLYADGAVITAEMISRIIPRRVIIFFRNGVQEKVNR